MIPLVNSLTIYALGLELGEALPGAAVAGVRRLPDCVTIYLEGAPFPYAALQQALGCSRRAVLAN